MGTYETIPGLDRALDEVSIPTRKKKNTKANTKSTSLQKLKSYNLLQTINNHIKFFGKIQTKNEKVTAEFICRCGEAFRSELPPILSGKIKTCGCKTK